MKESVDKKRADNSAGIVGVVLGIMSIVSGGLGIILGFTGFWFALYQHKNGRNKWSLWGLILTILGFVISVVVIYYFYTAVQGSLAQLQGLQGSTALG